MTTRASNAARHSTMPAAHHRREPAISWLAVTFAARRNPAARRNSSLMDWSGGFIFFRISGVQRRATAGSRQ
jgi:hypothetical protein